VLPGETAWPAEFSRSLKAEVKEGGRLVVCSLPPGSPARHRALLGRMVARITRRPTAAERSALLKDGIHWVAVGIPPRGKAGWRRPDGVAGPAVAADQNIRLHPPRVVVLWR
jgi:hypothetical protein